MGTFLDNGDWVSEVPGSTPVPLPVTTPGVLVRTPEGNLGITTDVARKRTPQIAVQTVGAPYPRLYLISELTRYTIQAKTYG